jgi:hypothetical protein
MAIKLGKNPKSFTREIPLVTLEGVTDILVITYKYRSRIEFADLLDEHAAAEKMAEAAATTESKAVTPTAKESLIKMVHEAAERVLEVATGWDIDDAFTVDNLAQLENDFPGALLDIQNVYQSAVLEVRRKN